MSTDAPIPTPEAPSTITVMMGSDTLTAARASSPRFFPMITESAALYVSCMMFPSTMGTVYSSRCRVIDPWVMSTFAKKSPPGGIFSYYTMVLRDCHLAGPQKNHGSHGFPATSVL